MFNTNTINARQALTALLAIAPLTAGVMFTAAAMVGYII